MSVETDPDIFDERRNSLLPKTGDILWDVRIISSHVSAKRTKLDIFIDMSGQFVVVLVGIEQDIFDN